jgi:transposase
MKHHNEYQTRCKAIYLYEEGCSFNNILRLVQGSRGWLSKWLRRFEEQGLQGLQDKSRAPKRIQNKTPDHLVNKILSIREELESHKTRRSAFSGIGAEVIQWEFTQRTVRKVQLLIQCITKMP